MQLQDFNQIDLKTAGNLPWPMKAVLLALLSAALLLMGYTSLLNPKLKQLRAAEDKEMALRDEFMAKNSQAIQIKAYQQQMQAIQRTFGTLLKQLPDKSEMDGLLTDINQAGLEQGLSFDAFVPKEEHYESFYAEKPILIRVVGKYHALGAFTTAVSRLPRIVTLNDVQIQPQVTPAARDDKSNTDKTRREMLVMEATAKTYRYLDDVEIAARKAQEKKAAKP